MLVLFASKKTKFLGVNLNLVLFYLMDTQKVCFYVKVHPISKLIQAMG